MLERIYIHVYVGTTYRLGQLRLPYICSIVLLLNYIGKRNYVHKVRTGIPHGSFGVWMEQDESADIPQCPAYVATLFLVCHHSRQNHFLPFGS